jgi:hypothetical protein
MDGLGSAKSLASQPEGAPEVDSKWQRLPRQRHRGVVANPDYGRRCFRRRTNCGRERADHRTGRRRGHGRRQRHL